jgi:triacylglycerol lipase
VHKLVGPGDPTYEKAELFWDKSLVRCKSFRDTALGTSVSESMLVRILVYFVLFQIGEFCDFSPSVAHADDPESARAALTRPYRSVRDAVYRRVGGEKLTVDIFRPVNDEVRPAVLMIHGGAWSSGDKWHMHDHARELAQEGFVAITINYRLAPQHKINEQIDDCRVALEWVGKSAEKYRIDPKRIALWGYSAGAHLACMLATQPDAKSPPVIAVVAGGAPCDFLNIPEDSQVLSLVMGGTRKELPDLYRNVSPLNFVNSQCPPTFFYHGSTDIIVPPATSRRMHEALQGNNVETEYFVIEGKGHLTTFLDGTARRSAIEFLNKHLSSEH